MNPMALSDVAHFTDLSASDVMLLIAQGLFPRPMASGEWFEREVDLWLGHYDDGAPRSQLADLSMAIVHARKSILH